MKSSQIQSNVREKSCEILVNRIVFVWKSSEFIYIQNKIYYYSTQKLLDFQNFFLQEFNYFVTLLDIQLIPAYFHSRKESKYYDIYPDFSVLRSRFSDQHLVPLT